jgi:uncharacterized protein involved in type VI secretion and phage assembly
MMNHLLNQMRLQAELTQGSVAQTRTGLVDSYDPGSYSCKVNLQPDNTLTGWLPILSPWVGNGWGMFAPPTIGDLVEVPFLEGDINAGVIALRFFNDADRPLPCPAGEFWLQHKSGAYLKFTNDGKFTVNSQLEIDATAPTINITAATAVNVVAPAVNIGAAGQALHGIVTDAMTALFNSHTHNDPQGGATGVPNQVMGAGQITTTIKGG